MKHLILLLVVVSLARAALNPADWPEIGQASAPTLSPDGHWIAFTSRAPDQVRRVVDGIPYHVSGVKLWLASESSSPIEVSPATAWSPSFSPDAKTLAFVSLEGGRPQLWVFDVASGQRRRLNEVRIAAREGNLDAPAWNPAGTMLYTAVVTREREAKDAPSNPYDYDQAAKRFAFWNNDRTTVTSAVGAFEVATGKVTILPGPGPLSFTRHDGVSPSGRWLVTLSSEFKLGVVDLTNGELHALGEMSPLITDFAMAGSDLFSGVIWSPNTDRLVYLSDHRPVTVTCTTGAVSPPVPLGPNLPKLAFGRNNPLAYGVEGRWLAGPVVVDDALQMAVIPVDGSPGRLIRLLNEATRRSLVGTDASSPTTGLDVLRTSPGQAWEPASGHVYVQYPDRDRGDIAVLDVDVSKGDIREVLHTRARWQITGARGRDCVALLEDFTIARNFFPIRAELTRGTPFLTYEPEPLFQQARMDSISAEVPDLLGVFRKVTTVVIRPPASLGTPRGAMVCIYPGNPISLSAGRYGAGNAVIVPLEKILRAGYAIVLPDILKFPPELGSKHEIVRPQGVLDSILPQLYLAAQAGLIDMRRLVVMGHSQGGLAALQAVSRSGVFRGAIGLSGVRYALYKGTFDLRSRGPDLYADGGDLTETLADALECAPALHADSIHAPVLLAHGESDAILGSELMADALRRAGRPVEFARYPGEAHNPAAWSKEHREDLERRIMEFLGRTLPPSEAAGPALPGTKTNP